MIEDYRKAILKQINSGKDLKRICKNMNIEYTDIIKYIAHIKSTNDVLYDDYIESKRLLLRARKSKLYPLMYRCLNGEIITKRIIKEVLDRNNVYLTDILKNATPKTKEEKEFFNDVIHMEKTTVYLEETANKIINDDPSITYDKLSDILGISLKQSRRICKCNDVPLNKSKKRVLDNVTDTEIKMIFNLAKKDKLTFTSARRKLGITFRGHSYIMEDKEFLEKYAEDVNELNRILHRNKIDYSLYLKAKDMFLNTPYDFKDIASKLQVTCKDLKSYYIEMLEQESDEVVELNNFLFTVKENSYYKRICNIIRAIISTKLPFEFLNFRNITLNGVIDILSISNLNKCNPSLISDLVNTVNSHPEIKSKFLIQLGIDEFLNNLEDGTNKDKLSSLTFS